MQAEIRLARVIELVEELELRKALYAELDKLIVELLEEGFTSKMFGPYLVELVDNFEDKNTAWKAAAIKRYDVKVTRKG